MKRILRLHGAVVAGGTVLLALLAAMAVLWAGRAGDAGTSTELGAPPSAADPIPRGPLVEKRPKDCGVSSTTVRRLAPKAELWHELDKGMCHWYSRARDSERSVMVVLDLYDGTQAGTIQGHPSSDPLAAAIVGFGTASKSSYPGLPSQGTTRDVAGLGDEALARYSSVLTNGGAGVIFRLGNVVAKIRYSGAQRDDHKQLPEKRAMDAVLDVAAEVARGLGTEPHPEIMERSPSSSPPKITPPTACSLVTKRLRSRIFTEPTATPESAESDSSNEPENGTINGCQWRDGADSRALEVEVRTMPSVDTAAHEYVKDHLLARGEKTLSVRDKKYFVAVAGLGDQAFAAYAEEGSPPRVVFRYRNVIAEASFTDSREGLRIITDPDNDDEDEAPPLDPDEAVKVAYAAAVDMVRALRR